MKRMLSKTLSILSVVVMFPRPEGGALLTGTVMLLPKAKLVLHVYNKSEKAGRDSMYIDNHLSYQALSYCIYGRSKETERVLCNMR